MGIRMSEEEYQALIKRLPAKKKSNKFGAVKTDLDGIKFDSKQESERYAQLKILEKSGLITGLKLQPKFMLQEGFIKLGKRYCPITYKADFAYYDVQKGQSVVEDVKGFETKDFKLKRKLFEYKYPDLTLTLVKRDAKEKRQGKYNCTVK